MKKIFLFITIFSFSLFSGNGISVVSYLKHRYDSETLAKFSIVPRCVLPEKAQIIQSYFSASQILKNLKNMAIILVSSTRRKLIRVDSEDNAHIHSPQPRQLKKEEYLIHSCSKDFPWVEFERLEQLFEQGFNLTNEEIVRFIKLKSMVRNRALVNPEPITTEPEKQTTFASYNRPGMRMIGGSCSKSETTSPLIETNPVVSSTTPSNNPLAMSVNSNRQNPLSSASALHISDPLRESPIPPWVALPSFNPNHPISNQQSGSQQAVLSGSANVPAISSNPVYAPEAQNDRSPSREPSTLVSLIAQPSSPDPQLILSTSARDESVLFILNNSQITTLQREINETMAILREHMDVGIL